MPKDDFLARFITIDAFHRQPYCSLGSYNLNVEGQVVVSLVASIPYHDNFKQRS